MADFFTLANIGLIIIALAWLVQLYHVVKIDKNITPFFILAYIVGVSLLVVSGYIAKLPVSYFELGTLVMAAIVLAFVLVKK